MASQPPPDPETLAVVTSAVAANGDGRAALTDNLVVSVQSIVRAFTDWYSGPAVRQLGVDIAAVVGPTQAVMASQEDAYLSQVTTTLAGRTFAPVGPVDVSNLRVGADPETVYSRLAPQYRYERSIGADDQTALDHVLTRADVMAQTDMALVARSEAEKFFEAHKITGYRRIIHPELSKGGTCGLCIAASDRIYKRDRLMPIHARCCCGVMPIIGGFDAGSALNDQDLTAGDLYGDAAGGSRKSGTDFRDLKRTRYKVDESGELRAELVPHDSGKPRRSPTTLGTQRRAG